jgi:hypothetical protein
MSAERLVFDLLAGLGLAVNAVVIVRSYATLPDRLPIHFDLRGRPDSWGPRWSILGFLALSAGIQVLVRWAGHSDAEFDSPVRITPENAARQERLARLLVDFLRVELAWLFAYLAWKTAAVARGRASGLGWPVVAAVLAVGVLTPLVWALLAFLAR